MRGVNDPKVGRVNDTNVARSTTQKSPVKALFLLCTFALSVVLHDKLCKGRRDITNYGCAKDLGR